MNDWEEFIKREKKIEFVTDLIAFMSMLTAVAITALLIWAIR